MTRCAILALACRFNYEIQNKNYLRLIYHIVLMYILPVTILVIINKAKFGQSHQLFSDSLLLTIVIVNFILLILILIKLPEYIIVNNEKGTLTYNLILRARSITLDYSFVRAEYTIRGL